jgi:glyoxylase-like metal-dependent hydrolase (beta-lactamase superfamily II)
LAQPDIVCLTNGVFQENCYIVADRTVQDAVLVDPGEEVELFLNRLSFEQLSLRAVWLTHAHVDHVMGVKRVVEDTGVPVYLHPADRPLYDGTAQQGAWLGIRPEQPPPPDFEFAHGDTVSVGTCEFEVRHVPGHSPGGVALVGHGAAIAGDALFAGSIGRTDLPGGDGAQLLRSIREQLLTLPDETVVYPGHGPATTVGEERRFNPFLTGGYPIG